MHNYDAGRRVALERNSLSGAPGRSNSSGSSHTAFGRALIVAASPISCIVIGRTIERLYLRSDAVEPEKALDTLRLCNPVLVIIDGQLDDTLIEPLLSELIRRRNVSEGKLPRIILVADPAQRRALASQTAIDAIVARPITPDTLQPVVERLMIDCGA